MDGNVTLMATLLALLAGLAIGKAWERYKLRDGRWIDRRRGRESPHYLLGLNFMAANQIDAAIEEFTRAADLSGDPAEIRLILGNLYREKGQVGRAIQEHQALLQQPTLRKREHANILLSLGTDYRRGGFVDRAVEAFKEVVRLDPDNQYALMNLEKLYEEQHQWEEAYAMRQKLVSLGAPDARQHQTILAFLENERGTLALKRDDRTEAARRFEAALDLDPANAPAHLNLGDLRQAAGDTRGAVAAWEALAERAPDRAYLALPRLESGYRALGEPHRYPEICARLIATSPVDWRGRLALARHREAEGNPGAALDLLFDALVHNPHALVLHREIWQTLSVLNFPPELVGRYMDRAQAAIFYLDPHLCVRCRYRSTELLWQCPHCHEWNTFVEERIAPAKDTEATLT